MEEQNVLVARFIIDGTKVHVEELNLEISSGDMYMNLRDAKHLKTMFNLDVEKKYPTGVIIRSDLFNLVQLNGTKRSTSLATELIDEYKVNVVAYRELDGQVVYTFHNGFNGNFIDWIDAGKTNLTPEMIDEIKGAQLNA